MFARFFSVSFSRFAGPLFRLDDPDIGTFPGKQTGNEHRHSLVDTDAFQVRAEAVGGHGEAFVLFHALRSFLLVSSYYNRVHLKCPPNIEGETGWLPQDMEMPETP